MVKKWAHLVVAATVLAAGAGVARAQVMAEPIPPDLIQLYGPVALDVFQKQFPNPPVKVEPEMEKAQGFHVKQQVAVIAIPHKGVNAKAIEEATDQGRPLGVVLTKSLSLEEKDAVINGDRLAVASVTDQIKLPVFFLSAKAQGPDRVLEVYSKEGKPLLSVPLKKSEEKAEGDAAAPLGLKLSNIDMEKRRLDATFSFAGGYQGTVKMGYVEP